MDRLRVLLVGPYYTPVGYYPQIEALGRRVELTTLLPDVSGWPMFGPETPWNDPARQLDMRGLPLHGSPRVPENLPDGVHICQSVHIPGSDTQKLMSGVTTWIRKTRPDVVVVTGKLWANTFWKAHTSVRLFAPDAKMVAVVKRNTYPALPPVQDKLKRALGRAGLRRATKLVTASHMASEMYRREFGAPPEKLAVAPLAGVDTDLFAPPAQNGANRGDLTIGYCGRFHAQKGVVPLVEAVELARAKGHRLRLHLVGNGPQRGELEQLATSREWLEITEPVPMAELAPFMRSFDLYVLAATTSHVHEEHDGHALLQAMATGLPCIGTRSGIIPEIMRDGEGLVVAANDIGALADAIDHLAGAADLRLKLGSAARAAAVRRYSFDAVADAHVTIWRDIAQERRMR